MIGPLADVPGGRPVEQVDDGGPSAGPGLIGVPALIAGVTLAVTQSYPTSIFDFVMGLHRRVCGSRPTPR